MFRLMVLLFVINILPFCFPSDTQSNDEIDGEEIGSLVEAYRSQAAAVRAGDVLFRVQSHVDSTGTNGEGDYRESEGFHRFQFDHDQNSFWYYGRDVSKRGSSMGGLTKQSEYTTLGAFSIWEGLSRRRIFPNRSIAGEFSDWATFVDTGKYSRVFLPTLGFCSFGGGSFVRQSRIADGFVVGDSKRSAVRLSSGDLKMSFATHHVVGPATHGETEWIFDTNLMVPTQSTLIMHFKNNVPTGVTLWKETYEWKEKNGNIYPVRLHREIPLGVRRGTEFVKYSDHEYVDFHWFSVNEPIQDKLFSASIDDPAVLAASIDPQKLGVEFND